MMGGAAQVRVRGMGWADVGRVMAIAAGLKEVPRWPREAYAAVLDPVATVRRIALVAVSPDQDGVVGFLVARVLMPQAELESIAVLAAEQRRGTGRKLLEAMAEELRGAGVREALLEVRVSNQAAFDFYRSLGWVETGRRPRYYADPEEDAVLMSLSLR
jgi:ribosomal-protein-alanine N-acetyltransferase